MARARQEPLTRREREIVEAIFARANRATAEDIRQHLPDPPSYSAVRALLARLEQKGHVRHIVDGPRYVYSVTTSQGTAVRTALRHHLRVFFEGSRSRMITALLQDGEWSQAELEALKSEIDRVSQERRRS